MSAPSYAHELHPLRRSAGLPETAPGRMRGPPPHLTSPPYWGLRDYGARGQLDMERTIEGYVRRLVRIGAPRRRKNLSGSVDSAAGQGAGWYTWLGPAQGLSSLPTTDRGKGARPLRNEFTAVIEPPTESDPWYIACCPEVPGANGQGRTKEEAKQNLAEGIALMLEVRREEGLRSIAPEALCEVVVVERSAARSFGTCVNMGATFCERGARTRFG